MANDVEIVVRSTDKSDLDAPKRKVKALGDEAKATGDKIRAAQKDTENFGKSSESAADAAKRGIKDLESEIGKLKASQRELQVEFSKTGDVDFLKGASKVQGAIKELDKFKDSLKRMGQDAEREGRNWGTRAAVGMGNALKSGIQSIGESIKNNPWISTAIAAGVIAGLPAIGAAVGVVFGAGVFAAAIASASRSQQVQQAWGSLSDSGSRAFAKFGEEFQRPLIKTISDVEQEFNRMDFSKIAAPFVPLMDDLDKGLVGFLHGLEPALAKLANFSAPFIKQLLDWLPELAHDIDGFAQRLDSASPGLQQFFGDLLKWVSNAITLLGVLVEAGAKVWQIFDIINDVLTGQWDKARQAAVNLGNSGAKSFGDFHNKTIDVNTAMGLLNGTIDKTGKAIGGLGPLVETLAGDDLKQLGADVDQVFNSIMSIDRANLSLAESTTSLGEELKKNHSVIDISSQKGQQLRESVLGVVQANIAEYDTMLKTGATAVEAADAYDVNTAALERQLRAAGLTGDQVEQLIGHYRGVPKNVDTNIEMHGLATAISDLDETLRLINGLPSRKNIDINVTTYYRSNGTPAPGAPGGLHGGYGYAFAHGGVIGAAGGGPRSAMTLVGEDGPELVSLPYGSTVHTTGDSARMMAGAGQGAPEGSGNVAVSVGFSGDLDTAFANLVMKMIRDGKIQIRSSQLV